MDFISKIFPCIKGRKKANANSAPAPESAENGQNEKSGTEGEPTQEASEDADVREAERAASKSSDAPGPSLELPPSLPKDSILDDFHAKIQQSHSDGATSPTPETTQTVRKVDETCSSAQGESRNPAEDATSKPQSPEATTTNCTDAPDMNQREVEMGNAVKDSNNEVQLAEKPATKEGQTEDSKPAEESSANPPESASRRKPSTKKATMRIFSKRQANTSAEPQTPRHSKSEAAPTSPMESPIIPAQSPAQE